MSQRYLPKMWVGIMQKQRCALTAQYPNIWDEKLIGVVIRSGRGTQCGHFMYWDVSICGKKMTASNAEARIYPFHYVTLEEGVVPPEDMVPALGFCKSGNGYAFLWKGEPHLIEGPAMWGPERAFVPVAEDEVPDGGWKLA